MSLREDIEQDLTDSILSEDAWIETVIQWPKGVEADAITIEDAFVDRSKEPGTNEVDGDGATPDSAEGRRIRASWFLDLRNDVVTDKKDVWIIDGEKFSSIRVDGRDATASGRQTLRIVAVDKDFTRQPRLRATADWRARSKG